MSADAESVPSNIMVAVRIRPLSGNELDAGHRSCCQLFASKVVAIKKNGDQGGYLKSQQPMVNEYAFDEVFDNNAEQKDVYERTAKRFIPYLLDGQNVTVFAYGATGAGKTHTMLGNTRADSAAQNAEAGIIPNAVRDVFMHLSSKLKQCSFGESYKVFVNFLEVYNEQVYDLLEPSGRILAVREDKEKGIVAAAGLTEQPVTSYDQVIEYIVQGNKQRKTEATMANVVSSRSHAILQLTVRHTVRTESGREGTIESKLSLIDLAGSERASATNNRGARLQEGANINKSLLALANCINALSENANGKKSTNVKYRDSKLTHLLRSSLEGNGHLVMIANINPSDQTYEDSHNTLKYANRAKNIKVNPAAKGLQMKETSWVEREAKLREENLYLRNTIRSLEDKIIELEYFKSTVLANNGVLPADFDVAEGNGKMVGERLSDVFDLSLSTVVTEAEEREDKEDDTFAGMLHEDILQQVCAMEESEMKPKTCHSPTQRGASKISSRPARESFLPTAMRRVGGASAGAKATVSATTAAAAIPEVPAQPRPHISTSVSMEAAFEMAVEEVEETTVDLSKVKKRRASFLPTRARSSKRPALLQDGDAPQSLSAAGGAMPVHTPVYTTVELSSSAAPLVTTPTVALPVGKVDNPMAWVTDPNAVYAVSEGPARLVNLSPIQLVGTSKPAVNDSSTTAAMSASTVGAAVKTRVKVSSEERRERSASHEGEDREGAPAEETAAIETKPAWMEEHVPFDIGLSSKYASSSSALSSKTRRQSTSRTSVSGVIGGASRRRSLAHVSALLDSLQQDVAASVTVAASMESLGTQMASQPVGASTPATEPPQRVTRSKALQAIDPNVAPSTTPMDAKDSVSKSAGKDSRRKSMNVMKATFSVDAVNLHSATSTPVINNENAAPLRRSTRRASMSVQHAWIDV